MGILNITPDSFSDGGQYTKPDVALKKALNLIQQGADLIDIGGESSRPGAKKLSVGEELDRVIPIIEKVRAETDVVISIDTCKAAVMKEAVTAGAAMINDIRALQEDGSLQQAARLNVPVCLMHMQGTPDTMQANPHYQRPIIEVINNFFSERIAACHVAGIPQENLILDPGFGFGKSMHHNLLLLKHFHEFQQHQLPLLLGVSRKSTLGALLNKDVHERITGGITMALFAALQGMSIIRTHDVEETKQAFIIMDAIKTVDVAKSQYK